MVGVLSDDTDPMVTVMKLEKAPQETYADIGGNLKLSILSYLLSYNYVLHLTDKFYTYG